MGVRALVICHAGTGIGQGHLSRSLVVAKILQVQLGMDVYLQVHGEPMEHRGLVPFTFRFVSRDQSMSEAILEAVVDWSPQIVLLDIHQASVPDDFGGCLQVLRRMGTKVIAIDGLAPYQAHLDLIYLPSIREWIDLEPDATVPVVYGWDCLLLPSAPPPATWQVGKGVLILTGGADATGLGRTWPAYLDAQLESGTHMHWVRGPYSQPPELPEPSDLQWTIHNAPQGLMPLMSQCQYAVTVFGVAFFELLQQGLPTIVFSPYGQKDDADLQRIAQDGVAVIADDERDAVKRLLELMGDPDRCIQLSVQARSYVQSADGRKIAEQVARLCAADTTRKSVPC